MNDPKITNSEPLTDIGENQPEVFGGQLLIAPEIPAAAKEVATETTGKIIEDAGIDISVPIESPIARPNRTRRTLGLFRKSKKPAAPDADKFNPLLEIIGQTRLMFGQPETGTVIALQTAYTHSQEEVFTFPKAA